MINELLEKNFFEIYENLKTFKNNTKELEHIKNQAKKYLVLQNNKLNQPKLYFIILIIKILTNESNLENIVDKFIIYLLDSNYQKEIDLLVKTFSNLYTEFNFDLTLIKNQDFLSESKDYVCFIENILISEILITKKIGFLKIYSEIFKKNIWEDVIRITKIKFDFSKDQIKSICQIFNLGSFEQFQNLINQNRKKANAKKNYENLYLTFNKIPYNLFTNDDMRENYFKICLLNKTINDKKFNYCLEYLSKKINNLNYLETLLSLSVYFYLKEDFLSSLVYLNKYCEQIDIKHSISIKWYKIKLFQKIGDFNKVIHELKNYFNIHNIRKSHIPFIVFHINLVLNDNEKVSKYLEAYKNEEFDYIKKGLLDLNIFSNYSSYDNIYKLKELFLLNINLEKSETMTLLNSAESEYKKNNDPVLAENIFNMYIRFKEYKKARQILYILLENDLQNINYYLKIYETYKLEQNNEMALTILNQGLSKLDVDKKILLLKHKFEFLKSINDLKQLAFDIGKLYNLYIVNNNEHSFDFLIINLEYYLIIPFYDKIIDLFVNYSNNNKLTDDNYEEIIKIFLYYDQIDFVNKIMNLPEINKESQKITNKYFYLLRNHYYEKKNYEKTLVYAFDIDKQDSKSVENLQILLDCLLNMNRISEAEQIAKRLIEIDKESSLALKFIQKIEWKKSGKKFKKGWNIELDDLYDSIFNNKLKNKYDYDSIKSNFLYSKGNIYATNGDIQNAKIILIESIKTDPYNINAYKNLAAIYSRENDLSHAIQIIYLALMLNKKDISLLNILGGFLIGIQDFSEAEKNYQQILDFSTNNNQKLSAYIQLGSIYFKTAEYLKAKKSFENALKISPNHSAALLTLNKINELLLNPDSVNRTNEIISTPIKISSEQIDEVSEDNQDNEIDFSIHPNILSEFILEDLKHVNFKDIKKDISKLKKYEINELINKLNETAYKVSGHLPERRSELFLQTIQLRYLCKEKNYITILKDIFQYTKFKGDYYLKNNKYNSAFDYYLESLTYYYLEQKYYKKIHLIDTIFKNNIIFNVFFIYSNNVIPDLYRIEFIEDDGRAIISKLKRYNFFDCFFSKNFNQQISKFLLKIIIKNKEILNDFCEIFNFENIYFEKMKSYIIDNLIYYIKDISNFEMPITYSNDEIYKKSIEITQNLFAQIEEYFKKLILFSENIDKFIGDIDDLIKNLKNLIVKLLYDSEINYFYKLVDIQNELRKLQIYQEKDKLLTLQNLKSDIKYLIEQIDNNPTIYSRKYYIKIFINILNNIEAESNQIASKIKPNIIIKFTDDVITWNNPQIRFTYQNIGQKAAENLKIEFLEAPNFTIIGNRIIEIPYIHPNSAQSAKNYSIDIVNKNETDTLDITLLYKYQDDDGNKYPEDETLKIEKTFSFEQTKNFEPFNNPYNLEPVDDEKMYYGRNELITELLSEFSFKGSTKSAVLLGPRRIGKTSTLIQLKKNKFDKKNIMSFYFSFQGRVDNDETLYSELIDEIESELKKLSLNTYVNIPSYNDVSNNPSLSFNRFIRNLCESFKEKDIIILFDEFEDIFEAISNNKINEGFYGKIKGLVQTMNNFKVILCGSEQMESILNKIKIINNPKFIPIGYLDESSAHDLIVKPIKELRYDSKSLNELIEKAGYHPYYIQILCSEIVNLMNQKKRSIVTIHEVHDVIYKHVLQANYFIDLWDINKNEKITLSIIASLTDDYNLEIDYFKITDLNNQFNYLTNEELNNSLGNLKSKHRILERNNCYRFIVDVFRLWIKKDKHIDTLLREEF